MQPQLAYLGRFSAKILMKENTVEPAEIISYDMTKKRATWAKQSTKPKAPKGNEGTAKFSGYSENKNETWSS